MTQATNASSRVLVRDVSKTFGATRALSGADLEVRAGEVHTVMGENGSGKSTLVKILSGVHRTDSGELVVDGNPTVAMRSPAASRALGISTVFQEVLTIPGQSILENVWIGSKQNSSQVGASGRKQPRFSPSCSARRSTSTIRSRASRSPDVKPCASFARSSKTPSLLVLDESTSALDVATRNRLFELVRELTAGGASVLFISHRMDEVFQISDVITVLRGGTNGGVTSGGTSDHPGRAGEADVRRRRASVHDMRAGELPSPS